jgi:transcriptional regulator with PAS, ATPase and Fis domain
MPKEQIMDKNAWYKAFPGAITVTDENGIIVNMNAESRGRPEMQVGSDLIGQNAITCHKEPTQSKVRKIYEEQRFNVYEITLKGKKQLVYQAPYFIDDKFSGIVEMVLDLPDEVPHFDRDAERAAKKK